jgi:hypothetical protein
MHLATDPSDPLPCCRWGDSNGNMLTILPQQTIKALRVELHKLFSTKVLQHRWVGRAPPRAQHCRQSSPTLLSPHEPYPPCACGWAEMSSRPSAGGTQLQCWGGAHSYSWSSMHSLFSCHVPLSLLDRQHCSAGNSRCWLQRPLALCSLSISISGRGHPCTAEAA